MATAEQTSALYIVILLLGVLFPLGRLFIEIFKRKRKANMYTEAFFYTSIVFHVFNISTLYYFAMENIKWQKTIKDPDMVATKMMDPYYLKIMFGLNIGYAGELWSLKATFISYYWTLFKNVSFRLKILLYGCVAFTISTFVLIIGMLLLGCRPISGNWSSDLDVYNKCGYGNTRFTQLFQNTTNIVTDVVVLILPLTIIGALKLERTVLYAVSFVFALAGLSIGSTIARLCIISHVMRPEYSGTLSDHFEAVRVCQIFASIEVFAGIAAFCLLSMRIYVIQFMGTGNRPQNGNANGGGGGGRLRFRNRLEGSMLFSQRRRKAKRMNFTGTDLSVGDYLRTIELEEVQMGTQDGTSMEELTRDCERADIP